MFKNEKHALVALYKLNNYGIERKIDNVCFDDESSVIDAAEYQFDLKYDLNKLFYLLPKIERDILMLYIYYENKHKASIELGMPYTTYRRKFKKSLEKWKDILIKYDYIPK